VEKVFIRLISIRFFIDKVIFMKRSSVFFSISIHGLACY